MRSSELCNRECVRVATERSDLKWRELEVQVDAVANRVAVHPQQLLSTFQDHHATVLDLSCSEHLMNT